MKQHARRLALGLQRALLRACYARRWPRSRPLEPGYAILLPMPADMPFLLRFALEGLRRLNTENCKQIIIVPDTNEAGDARGLREVAAEFDDPRIETALPPRIDYAVLRLAKGGGVRHNGAHSHWLQCVSGTARTRCEYAFLHDADAFHLDLDGVERQYRECRDRGMHTLGVTARGDTFFLQAGRPEIPGTWELMYSTAWAFERGAYAFKGGVLPTPLGEGEFDSMLHPQFLDYPSGKIGVMKSPPELVHFYGVIGAFRVYQERRQRREGRPIVDQRLRILLLALLEDLVPSASGDRALPTVAELARGLEDPAAPVTYATVEAAVEYPTFRENIEALCRAPIFQGERADRLRERLGPFDAYYRDWAAKAESLGPAGRAEPHYIRYGVA